MIIHGPAHTQYDYDLGPILLVRDRNLAQKQVAYLASPTITTLVISSSLSATQEPELFQIQTTILLMARWIITALSRKQLARLMLDYQGSN